MRPMDKAQMYLEYMNRRQFLKYGAVAGAGAAAGCLGGTGGEGSGSGTSGDYSEQVTLSVAAPSIGFPAEDPLGQTFMDEYNVQMEHKSVPATPADMIKLFVAGDGQEQFDAIWDNGGAMEDLLGERDALSPIESDSIPTWGNLASMFEEGSIYRHTMEYDGNLMGTPSARNADTVAFLEDEIDEPDSWGVIFDSEYKGQTAVIDDYANTPHWTALYLWQNDRSDVHDADVLSDSQWDAINSIEGPQVSDLDPDQLTAVIDYLVAQKQMGQFKAIWQSFGNVVNMLVNGEIVATYTYEPAVIEAQNQGANVGYPPLREGCFEWNDHWYMTKGAADRNNQEAYYRLATWALEPQYGADLHDTRGYESGVAEDLVLEYMEENYSQDKIDRNQEMLDIRQTRFDANGDLHAWNNPNPTELDMYLDEWNRFLNA